MADKKKMSVEEILSACRQQGGASDRGAEPAESGDASPASQTPPPAPAGDPSAMGVDDILAAARAEKAGGEKSGGEKGSSRPQKAASGKPAAAVSSVKSSSMSIDDILAAARAGKAAGASEKVAAAKKETPKPATKPKSKAPAKVATPETGGPTDTSSILTAARNQVKRGPMSKSEAAARGQTVASEPEARSAKSKPKADRRRVPPPMPKKPDYAQAKGRSTESAEGKRRGFLVVLLGSSLAIGFTSLSSVFTLFTLGLARYMFPNILTEPPNVFKVGFPADFAAGMVETKFKALFGVWVVNAEYDGQAQIVALKSVCTHLGCTPNWLDTEQKFKCPCHGSGFYKDGINFEGPAPRPLERYAIRLADDGQLEVDKSRTFQEEMGQWRDPACFVSV